MFEILTEKLNGVFQRLGNKGTLTERDVDEALREVRLALLEADVNFRWPATWWAAYASAPCKRMCSRASAPASRW